MEIFGWVALIVFGLIGLAIVAFALAEFLLVQIRIFSMKIGKELEVIREDIKASGELKKARLAKKRAAKDKFANKKLDAQISVAQEKSDEKYGKEKEVTHKTEA